MATSEAPPARSRIFICYRRKDSDQPAARLADDLRRHFAPQRVFLDFASIDPGLDFVEAVEQGLDTAAAVLVVIGTDWLSAVDKKGRRRLDLVDDWVRHEVAESLKRPGVRVFPVLVDEAEMPGADDLPEPLRPLTRRQAFPLTVRHWPNDVGQLIEHLKRVPGLDRPVAAGPRQEKPAEPARPAPEPAPSPPPRAPERAQEARADAQRSREPPAAEMPAGGGTGPGVATGGGRTIEWKLIAVIGAALIIGLLLVFGGSREPKPVPVPASPPQAASPPAPAPETSQAKPPVERVEPIAPAATTLKAGESFRDCDRCPEMVVIPAGEFVMGSPKGEKGRNDDEGPQHKVVIARSFAVGKFEVTFDEWDACVAAGGCSHKPEDEGWGRGRRPVINVSWEDAQAYVGWLSKKTGKAYRLLSEAEWEYAARAGTTTRYPWGDEPGRNRANFRESGSQWSGKQTAPVGSFDPNAFGLHDMIGNVWEWTQDCWNESYEGALADGRPWESGDCGRRVVRGGGWWDEPGGARSAGRDGVGPGGRGGDQGFRLARTL